MARKRELAETAEEGVVTPQLGDQQKKDATGGRLQTGKRRPSMRQAVLAKCHDCMGEYVDGRCDCGVPRCALYYWMPYGKLEPDLSWTRFNPRRVGLVERDDEKNNRAEVKDNS